MGQTMTLILGLTAVFAGVLGIVIVSMGLRRERSQIAHSLATIEAFGPVPESMKRELDVPFADRVVRPTMAGLRSLAIKLTPADWHQRAGRRLDLAGNPAGWDTDRLLAMKSGAGILFGALTAVFFLAENNLMLAVLGGAAMAVFGFFLPDILVTNTAQKRSALVQRELPDSIDLLTICVESGLALDAGLAQVAASTDGPLSDELHRTLKEIQLGSGRTEALRALADRSDVEDLRNFIASLAQAESLGIPVADVLRVQSKEMRLKRSQRAEEAAMKLPVKIIFPLLLCILPAIFVVILGPAAINIAETFSNL